jgi:hypothetical protein
MDLYNISYNDPKVRRAVDGICGKPFGFWEGVRRGGTGSYRFQLLDAPGSILARIDRDEDRRFCSLEVRQGGLLVRLKDRLETLAVPFAWTDLQRVQLGSPNAERLAPLQFLRATGERLVFGVRREQWGSMDRLLRGSLPPDRYRTTAASDW